MKMSGITLYLSGTPAYFEVSTPFKGIAKEIINLMGKMFNFSHGYLLF